MYDDKTFIGAGGVSFYQVMPTYHNPSGKKAYILNMYTAPAYRRQEIAYTTLGLLVEEAKKKGISQISLEATDMRRGQRQITDAEFLRKIIMFLADNIGNNTSITSIGNTLVNEKLIFFMKSSVLIPKGKSILGRWENT